MGGCTVAELAERMEWWEFIAWRQIFKLEDRELAQQKAEMERKAAEADARGPKRKGGGAGEVVVSSKAKRQAALVHQTPAFKPPAPGKGKR